MFRPWHVSVLLVVPISAGSGSTARMKFKGTTYDNLEGMERYLHYPQKPIATDSQNAGLAGGDIKCEVCAEILKDVFNDLVQRKALGTKEDRDVLAEAIDADNVNAEEVDRDEPGTDMEKWVKMHRKGCNRLFKDNFLVKGWTIFSCHRRSKGQPSNTPPDLQAPWACIRQSRRLPTDEEMDTYSVQNEAVHFACESTIGDHKDNLVEFLHKGMRNISFEATLKPSDYAQFASLAEKACKKVGKCEKRKASDTAEARVEKMSRKAREQDWQVDHTISKVKKDIKQAKPKDKTRKRKERRRKARMNSDL